LPVGDHHLVGAFVLLDEVAFAAPEGLVVVGEARSAVAVGAGGACGKFELAALVCVERGSGEGVVLVLGDEVPVVPLQEFRLRS
jgi:hypothetical protein